MVHLFWYKGSAKLITSLCMLQRLQRPLRVCIYQNAVQLPPEQVFRSGQNGVQFDPESAVYKGITDYLVSYPGLS